MNDIVRSGLAGAVATGVMAVVILGGKITGLLQTPPPKHIAKRLGQEVAGKNPGATSAAAFNGIWLSAHLAFGVACGCGYGLLRSSLPLLIPKNTLLAGLVYGLGVWSVSYLGLMPVLGLYPWPEKDSASRTGVMIAAHAVFGVSLAEVDQRLSR